MNIADTMPTNQRETLFQSLGNFQHMFN